MKIKSKESFERELKKYTSFFIKGYYSFWNNSLYSFKKIQNDFYARREFERGFNKAYAENLLNGHFPTTPKFNTTNITEPKSKVRKNHFKRGHK